jgi:hypothetical protein
MSFVAAGLLLFAACGGGDGSTRQAGICPANPTFCSGTCCGDVCTDTTSDSANCGACGTACDTNTACVNSHCGCPPNGGTCGQGQTCCGENGCKSLLSDVNNCNGCGIACASGETCDNGKCDCGGVVCGTGQMCCNGACSASCSTAPDMSMGGGACDCTGQTCELGCDGDGCCIENIIFGSCVDNPTCP